MAASARQLSVGVAARRLIVGSGARQLLIMLGMLKWRCEPPQARRSLGVRATARTTASKRSRAMFSSFRACTIETVKSKYEDHVLSELGPRPGTVSGTYKRHVAARPVLFISQVTVTFVEHAIPILPRRRSAGCEMR